MKLPRRKFLYFVTGAATLAPCFMSALSHKQTLGSAQAMSALPPKADIDCDGGNVRFVPKADICAAAK